MFSNDATRLAVVVSHPIQYYAPWFRWLCQHTALHLRVFYLSTHGVAANRDAQFGQAFAWDTDLLEGYEHEFVPNIARQPDVTRFGGLHNPALKSHLATFRPDAILLFGYAYRPHLRLLWERPAPILFRGDSHLLGGSPPRGLKRMLLRALYARPAAFLPVGTANAAYFRHYGVPEHKFFHCPHCVDRDHFTATPEHRAEAAGLRESLGILVDAPVALFAGKLITKKQPDLLLAAFRQAAVADAHLVIAGDGEMLPELRNNAAGLANVHFLPFANQSAMPARYLLGDVFILPSHGRHETWGLAVNEAMHLERPVIVSSHVGCHFNLVPAQDTLASPTGWVFPAGDQAALAATLRKVLTLPRDHLIACGRAAAGHVAAYNYEVASQGLLNALEAVLGNPR